MITYEMDSGPVRVPVTISPGGDALDMSSAASVEAVAKKAGSDTVEIDAAITDPSGGIVTLTFATDSLTDGVWRLQVRVTLGTEVQTVVDEALRVKDSVRAPA